MSKSYDPVWDDIYESKSHPRAPYDFVASFVFRNAPQTQSRKDVKILEIGCGSGSNLWFLALEGFSVSGVDGSKAAIHAAQERLQQHNCSGDLRVADFTNLPFDPEMFDLVIDRGALTCTGTSMMKKAIGEVHRVLKTGGKFLYNPISDSDTSYRSGVLSEDDLITDIEYGDFKDVGQIRFVSRSEIDSFLPKENWIHERVERVEITDMLSPFSKIVSNWRVEAQKNM